MTDEPPPPRRFGKNTAGVKGRVTMITFTEYTDLARRNARCDIDREPLTDAEYSAMQEFAQAQPGECPRCRAQVFDPFGLGRVVHDIAACSGIRAIA